MKCSLLVAVRQPLYLGRALLDPILSPASGRQAGRRDGEQRDLCREYFPQREKLLNKESRGSSQSCHS